MIKRYWTVPATACQIKDPNCWFQIIHHASVTCIDSRCISNINLLMWCRDCYLATRPVTETNHGEGLAALALLDRYIRLFSSLDLCHAWSYKYNVKSVKITGQVQSCNIRFHGTKFHAQVSEKMKTKQCIDHSRKISKLKL